MGLILCTRLLCLRQRQPKTGNRTYTKFRTLPRKANGNSEIRTGIPKTEWELPNPNRNSEIRTGTLKSERELRNPNGNSEIRTGTLKGISGLQIAAPAT